jgi:hypothetical protein
LKREQFFSCKVSGDIITVGLSPIFIIMMH